MTLEDRLKEDEDDANERSEVDSRKLSRRRAIGTMGKAAIAIGAVVIAAGGVAAYFATRPVEKIVETVTLTAPAKTEVITTTIAGKEIVVTTTIPGRTEVITTTVPTTTTVAPTTTTTVVTTVAPTTPAEERPWELIDWNRGVDGAKSWAERLTGIEIGNIPSHWMERWKFLGPQYGRPEWAAIGGYQLPVGWEEAVKGVERIRFLNYGGMAHDPATAMAQSAFEDMTGIRVENKDMEELTLWLKTVSILTAKSDAIDVLYVTASLNAQQMARSGWLQQVDFAWPPDVQKLYAPGVVGAFYVDNHWWSIGGQAGPKPFVLFHRPSWLQRATGSSEAPKTFLELVDVAQQCAEWAKKEFGGGYYGLNLPGKDHRYMWGAMLGPLYSQGGSFLDKEGRVQVLTPEFENTWKLFIDFYKTGGVPMDSLGWSWSESPEIFMRGKSAMTYAGSVNATRYHNPEIAGEIQGDWAINPPLSYDTGDKPATGDPWIGLSGVNPYIKPNQKAAAMLWSDFYRSYQTQWNELVYEGNETYAVALYDHPEAKAKAKELEMRKASELVGVTVSLPPGGDAILTVLLEWFHKAVLGEVPEDEALANAQRDIDDIQVGF